MPASELTNTQALIDRYYTEEKAKKAQALTRASLNLQLDANDLAMLSTIAKRFGKSRDDLAKDVLSHALIDLLTQLEPGERKLIARDADEMGSSMAREIAEENGIKEIDHKPNVWTAHERAIAKAEKKLAKELEAAKKAEQQAQASANLSEEALASSEAHVEAQAETHLDATNDPIVESPVVDEVEASTAEEIASEQTNDSEANSSEGIDPVTETAQTSTVFA
jgi:hypothetical protein